MRIFKYIFNDLWVFYTIFYKFYNNYSENETSELLTTPSFQTK